MATSQPPMWCPVGEHIFARCLDGGDGALLGRCDFDELLRAALAGDITDREMIADEVEKGLIAGEFAGAKQGLPVTARLKLLNEVKLAGQVCRRLGP